MSDRDITRGPGGPTHERRLPVLLRGVWFPMNQAFRRRIAHLGVTPDQFTALRWLSEAKGRTLTQRALTDRMASDPNTIASLLRRMEKAALISRRPDPDDRRANHVTPTAKGRAAFDKAKRIATALQAELLGVVPAGQREAFLRNLARTAAAARQLTSDA